MIRAHARVSDIHLPREAFGVPRLREPPARGGGPKDGVRDGGAPELPGVAGPQNRLWHWKVAHGCHVNWPSAHDHQDHALPGSLGRRHDLAGELLLAGGQAKAQAVRVLALVPADAQHQHDDVRRLGELHGCRHVGAVCVGWRSVEAHAGEGRDHEGRRSRGPAVHLRGGVGERAYHGDRGRALLGQRQDAAPVLQEHEGLVGGLLRHRPPRAGVGLPGRVLRHVAEQAQAELHAQHALHGGVQQRLVHHSRLGKCLDGLVASDSAAAAVDPSLQLAVHRAPGRHLGDRGAVVQHVPVEAPAAAGQVDVHVPGGCSSSLGAVAAGEAPRPAAPDARLECGQEGVRQVPWAGRRDPRRVLQARRCQ
mmetsp:Transcript_45376/g.130044  ORF Transcript_45376/g.130044 Transcript_45376/m.130044 type:complete len:365 (-) Transcript_45376:1201-2295(-)